MRILLINGSPHKNGATKRALDECEGVLLRFGAKSEHFWMGGMSSQPCTACCGCKSERKCVFGDLEEIKEKIKSADGIIIGIPTHYASAPGNIISSLSRLLFSAKECVEYKPIAVIGAGRRGGVSSAIDEIVKFFTFISCPIVSGGYPPIIYGSDYDSAGFDGEGLQNMRSVSENMYWLISAIEIAEKNGLHHPIAEQKIKTDIPSLL